MQTALPQSSTSLSTAEFIRSIPGKVVVGLAATLVVAAAAYVSVPLWFTPVPLTLQPLAVLCVGLFLGPTAGFLAMLAYLAEGALGLPVFSPLGPGGVAQLVGPTGGYLMSYPLIAFIAGAITRGLQTRTPRFFAAALGCTAAVAVLFACGAGWLAHFLNGSLRAAWLGGIFPFLPGEAIKVVAAAGLYSSLARYRRS
jgi:biotin transport system substrate-specific component